jgi:hypothetical protein
MTKYALLIGITYFNTESKIYGSVNDVIMMKKFLIEVKGYNDDKIVVLRDDDDKYNQPTKDNIVNELNNLIQQSNEGATELFLYISGYSNLSTEEDGNCIYCSDLTYIDNNDFRFMLSNLNQKIPLFGIFDCLNLNNNFDLPYHLSYNYVLKDSLKQDREFINNKIIIYCQNRKEQKVYDNFANNKFGGFLTANMINFLKEGNTFYECLFEFYRLYNDKKKLPYIASTQDIGKLFIMEQFFDMEKNISNLIVNNPEEVKKEEVKKEEVKKEEVKKEVKKEEVKSVVTNTVKYVVANTALQTKPTFPKISMSSVKKPMKIIRKI